MAFLKGDKGDNTLVGSSGNDLMIGKAGDDLLQGGDGHDLLLGGRGDDQLDGGQGNDVLLGGRGDDILNGGQGNDVLLGGRGDDTLNGGDGNDFLKGGRGDDILNGGDGNDILKGGRGDDILSGGAGDDYVYGGRGNDVAIYDVDLNQGDTDVYNGGRGTDTLRLVVTQDVYDSAWFQQAMSDFQAHISSSNVVFDFGTYDPSGELLNLKVKNFELVEVEVLEGDILSSGVYRLHNHPDGNAAAPLYGLRLDELVDVTAGHDIFTFDFDAEGASMQLTYDALTNDISITGIVFGGLDVGSSYDPSLSGYYQINFTYANVEGVSNDGDLVVLNSSAEFGGTITNLVTGESFDLFTKANASGLTFRLGDTDDDMGHRGFDGISGWGWLNHTVPDTHVAASDWLFTLDPTLLGVNDAPDAVDDAVSTDQDTAIVIDMPSLLSNDTDPNSDSLTVISANHAVNGMVMIDYTAQTLTFTPDAGFSGVGHFEYTISDGQGGVDTAVVNVTVNPAIINQPPVVVLENVVTNLDENTDTSANIKVADIVVSDDGVGGPSVLSLSGSDAASFVIIDSDLFLRAGENLDFETQMQYNVTVEVDDASVGATPDDTAAYQLDINDLVETVSVLAVAYSDINSNNTFDPENGDRLIAQILDLNGNGAVDVGDRIELGEYPTNFEATAFADFITSSTLRITEVEAADSNYIRVISGGHRYEFGVSQFELQDSFREVFLDPSIPFPFPLSGPVTITDLIPTRGLDDNDAIRIEDIGDSKILPGTATPINLDKNPPEPRLVTDSDYIDLDIFI